VYRLHRETLHLAVDFVDRYLALTTDVRKDCLQLLGISALFVAAKLEVRFLLLISYYRLSNQKLKCVKEKYVIELIEFN
jgi:hypothetical protein